MNSFKKPAIFNLYKPKGWTSFDVVKYFKCRLPKDCKKVGHLGTLDSFSTGVLLLGVNGATRLNDYLHENLKKNYLATGKIGVKTISGDLSDDIIRTDNNAKEKLKVHNKDTLQEKFNSFIGDYMQVPPIISAAKYKGRTLYKWARSFKVEILKPPVKRKVYSIEVLEYNFPKVVFKVCCGKGVYIRKLFEDMAESLNTVGALKELERQSFGKMNCVRALFKKNWPIKSENFDYDKYSVNLCDILPLPSVVLEPKDIVRYNQGTLSYPCTKEHKSNLFWVYNKYDRSLLGLGKVKSRYLTVGLNLQV